jgi:hypothetical protein
VLPDDHLKIMEKMQIEKADLNEALVIQIYDELGKKSYDNE